jgi:hypothetical protein
MLLAAAPISARTICREDGYCYNTSGKPVYQQPSGAVTTAKAITTNTKAIIKNIGMITTAETVDLEPCGAIAEPRLMTETARSAPNFWWLWWRFSIFATAAVWRRR